MFYFLIIFYICFFLKKKYKIVVIQTYNNKIFCQKLLDLSLKEGYNEIYFVHNKDNLNLMQKNEKNNIKIFNDKRPNIGRDYGAYLYFITKYYNKLKIYDDYLNYETYIVFSSANLKKHNRIELFTKYIKDEKDKFINCLKVNTVRNFEIDNYEGDILNRAKVRPLYKWYNHYIGNFLKIENDFICRRGMLSGKIKTIIDKPLSFYKALLDQLDHNNHEVVHYLERVFYSIINNNYSNL